MTKLGVYILGISCFFLFPLVSFGAITYTRTPSDFYSGHGTVITVSSNNIAVDFKDCVEFQISHGVNDSGTSIDQFLNYFTASASISLAIPDNMLINRVVLMTWNKVSSCSDFDLLNVSYVTLEGVEYDDNEGSGPFLEYVFSTFPLITEDYDNLVFGLAILIFFNSMVFLGLVFNDRGYG